MADTNNPVTQDFSDAQQHHNETLARAKKGCSRGSWDDPALTDPDKICAVHHQATEGETYRDELDEIPAKPTEPFPFVG